MKTPIRFAVAVALLTLGISGPARSAEEQEMLWINLESKSESATTIAVSFPVAQELYASDKAHIMTGRENQADRDLQQLIADILDYRKDAGEVYDSEDDTRVRVWKGPATVPGDGKGDGATLVIEILEAGKRVTTIRLPSISVETVVEDEDAVIETSIGWRAFLPFLAERGGAVYISTEKDETEVWIYTK